MSPFNNIESDSGSDLNNSSEDKASDIKKKIVNGTAIVATVASAYGVGRLIHNSSKSKEEEKEPTPVTQGYDEDPLTVDSDIELDAETQENFVQEEIGDQEYIESEITQDEIEEVQEKTVVEEIKEMIEDISNQPFEVREQSKLTTDLGLIHEIGSLYPELGFPKFRYYDFSSNSSLENNYETKDWRDGFEYNSLLRIFNGDYGEIDKDSAMVAEISYYNDESEKSALIYTGNLPFPPESPNGTFYRTGDILSIVKYGSDPLTGGRYDDGSLAYRNSAHSVTSVQLAGIIDKQVNSDGEVTLTIAYSPEDTKVKRERVFYDWGDRVETIYENETREAKIIEVNAEEFKEFVGESYFVIRNHWENHAPEAYNLKDWDDRYKVVEVSEKSEKTGMYMVASGGIMPSGAKMYSLPFHEDGYLDKDGEIIEVLLPPGYLLNIVKTVDVETPYGQRVRLGVVGDEGGYWGIKDNSVVIIEVWFGNEGKHEDWPYDYLNRHFWPVSTSTGRWDTLQYGYLSQDRSEGWKKGSGFPYEVLNKYPVDELASFIDTFYSKEKIEDIIPSLETDEIKQDVRNILNLQDAINNYSEDSELPWDEYLKQHKWYIDYMTMRAQESPVSFEQKQQIDLALRYLTYGKVEGQPIQGIPLQVGLSLLYPELGIQGVGGATTIDAEGVLRGAVTVEDLVNTQEEDSNKKVVSSGYGGLLYKGIDSLDMIEMGDTILNPETEQIGSIIGVAEIENPATGELEKVYIYIGGNRHKSGEIFTTILSANNAPWLLGDADDIVIYRSNK
jgi:hypothetical protein